MNAAEYRKLVKTGISGAFLFCGEEDYLKQFCLAETRKSVTGDDSSAAFNIIRFSGAESSFSFGSVGDALSVPPFFCPRKLIELHDLDYPSLVENDLKILERLAQSMENSEDTAFILYADADEFDAGKEKRRTKLYDRFSAVLTVVEFNYETYEKLTVWLGKHFSAEKIVAEPEQCRMLIQRCGFSMYTLAGEAAKLCSYIHASGRDKLADSDIRLVTCITTDEEEYAMSNAVLDCDIKRAFRIMSEIKARKQKPELILAGISGVLCDLKLIRVLSEEGLSAGQIAAKTKIHEYKVGLYLKSLRRRDAGEMDALIEMCAQTDIKIKNTGLDSYMLIDRMLASMSENL